MKILERVGDKIVSSRLLVLQSKRILLANAKTRMRVGQDDPSPSDLHELESAVRSAHQRYNDAVLRWAPASSDQYLQVAYSSLISRAEVLHARLRTASDEMAEPDSNQLALEARMLESIIAGWRAVARRTMAAVA